MQDKLEDNVHVVEGKQRTEEPEILNLTVQVSQAPGSIMIQPNVRETGLLSG